MYNYRTQMIEHNQHLSHLSQRWLTLATSGHVTFAFFSHLPFPLCYFMSRVVHKLMVTPPCMHLTMCWNSHTCHALLWQHQLQLCPCDMHAGCMSRQNTMLEILVPRDINTPIATQIRHAITDVIS